jgi:hypothetical protein
VLEDGSPSAFTDQAKVLWWGRHCMK